MDVVCQMRAKHALRGRLITCDLSAYCCPETWVYDVARALRNTWNPVRFMGVVGFSLKATTRSKKVSSSISAETMLVKVCTSIPMVSGVCSRPAQELEVRAPALRKTLF